MMIDTVMARRRGEEERREKVVRRHRLHCNENVSLARGTM